MSMLPKLRNNNEDYVEPEIILEEAVEVDG